MQKLHWSLGREMMAQLESQISQKPANFMDIRKDRLTEIGYIISSKRLSVHTKITYESVEPIALLGLIK